MTEQNKPDWFRKGIESGRIGTADRELIRFLENEYGALTEDEMVLTLFCSLFLNAGHVCLPLDRAPREWLRILDIPDSELSAGDLPEDPVPGISDSALFGTPEQDTPFVMGDNSLAFRRQYRLEQELMNRLRERTSDVPLFSEESASAEEAAQHLRELFDGRGNQNRMQKAAAALSLVKPLLIISGGPGTGKTTTVAAITELHRRIRGGTLRLALAAPTGKAAGRMGEALKHEYKKMGHEEDALPAEAVTIHRLLRGTGERGLLPPAGRRTLDYDLVIVDEASMIDLNLMSRLVNHLGEHTRLILLGDRDQLASVEAGSVFADLCSKPENTFSTEIAGMLKNLGVDLDVAAGDTEPLHDSILYLTKSYRFGSDSGIGQLAALVKEGEVDPGVLAGTFQKFGDISHHGFSFDTAGMQALAAGVSETLKRFSGIDDPETLLEEWKREVWLTVHRRGADGSEQLNRYAEQLVQGRGVAPGGWYHGRVIMITRNDYGLSVFNGDIGVCVKEPGSEGRMLVYIESGSGMKVLPASRLVHYTPAWFMTVHKSQGSEFGRVNLLLPSRESPVQTRELIYTAITQARDTFHLYGRIEKLASGIARPTERFSGLGGMT